MKLFEIVLRSIDSAMIRTLRDDDLWAVINKACNQVGLGLHGNEYGLRNPKDVDQERRRDHLSHYILRLAFCGNPENIRWLVQQESVLLKCRFERISSGDRSLFLAKYSSDCRVAEREELVQVMDELRQLHGPGVNDDFFVVPWQSVPDLVGRRGVFLRKGYAYVPKAEAFSIILTRFKEMLEGQLERTAKELPALRDDRILPLLELVKKADPYSATGGGAGDASKGFIEGQLMAADVDRASVHFPLCMQHLHKNLRSTSHLKYGGRQQYGLFLKSIGLSLEEALAFWRRSFASKVSDDKFQKEYAYNVRHNYGQEGKRANYAPYSCSKIITSNAPSLGDHHGCPFKHHGPDSLRHTLANYAAPNGTRLGKEEVDIILDLVHGGHHQVACTKLFELTRKPAGSATTIDTITYPSKFYELSIKESK